MTQQLDIFDPPIPAAELRARSRQRWSGLGGASAALCIVNCARRHDGLVMVVAENTRQAERLCEETAFFAGAGERRDAVPVIDFPDWETLPYDHFSPHQDIVSRRLETLARLPEMNNGILIVPVGTLMHRIPPPAYIRQYSLSLEGKQVLDIADTRRNLEYCGYRPVDTVYEHGEFAVRGSIIDIFPMGSPEPYRIELFDTEIESLRSFDPESQVSRERVPRIAMLPGREYPLDGQSIEQVRQRFRESFDVDLRKCPLYQDISQAIATPGIEYYLPLFFTSLATLPDYLPDNTVIFTTGETGPGAEQFWREIVSRYEDRQVDSERPLFPPEKIFIPAGELHARLKEYPLVRLDPDPGKSGNKQYSLKSRRLPDLSVDHKLEQPLARLEKFLRENRGTPVLFCTDSAGRRETVKDLLKNIQVYPEVIDDWQGFIEKRPELAITIAPVETGMWLDEAGLVLITESQLFVHHVAQRRRREKSRDNTELIVKNLTELHQGAPVVHIDHGIGRYLGLECIDVEGQQTEFLILEYAEQAKLYVPVSSLHLISRYTGADAEAAPLHKLGSDQWDKTRRKAAEKIVDVAAELLDIHARRETKTGFQFQLPKQEYAVFAQSFPFEETEDQKSAIQAVIDDMSATRAMDRLVCGDVGFGKTEVAIRAAFIAVHNHVQVSILVPTTLLARQHFETFTDRLADWPVNIAMMSRLTDRETERNNLKGLADGTVDIVIGTHKLLQAVIKYRNLGLLIIDEEHRFGVRQKEQLKALRANVDILTLTATPIPRTLNMAMTGIRDLSIMVSPPARRLSIKTFIRQYDKALVKESIQRELLRGGQVFYLHNEVRSIEKTAEDLRKLVPEARVAVGHGKMRERELERIMSGFYHKHSNVLVCSTIIENGIDIPSANTIIIERADKFGLAQLHQLRGRVGRSHHQAYAYFLTPSRRTMNTDAIKRIEAVEAADTLGAGFTLAGHDLEIRGAGELLGEEQSGHIQNIGFSLYSEMLEQTIRVMKEGKQPNLDKPLYYGAEINLRVPALIPDSYLPDVHMRLLMYKRIASAGDIDELEDLKVEMIDRFGLPPRQLTYLFDVTVLKLRSERLGILKIEANIKSGKMLFKADTNTDPRKIVELIRHKPEIFTLSGESELRFQHESPDAPERIGFIRETLDYLERCNVPA